MKQLPSLILVCILGVIIGILIPYPPPTLRSVPPHVEQISPDQFTFAHRWDSPIFIVFDQEMDTASISSETVIVKAYPNGNETLVNGIIDAGKRMLMFRPDGNYPTGVGDTGVIIMLIGTDQGSGVIKSAKGKSLDGDNDGVSGGNYVYEYNILG